MSAFRMCNPGRLVVVYIAIHLSNIASAEEVQLPTLTVQGSGANLIRAQSQTADGGPLGALRVQETPFTINVVPQEIFRTQQLRDVEEAFRYLPSVQAGAIRPQSRGFQGSVVQNTRIDGLNVVSTTDYSAEQFERIEVLNGLSGALYGPTNPAGTFNYVLKRPTEQPYRSLRFGYVSGGSLLRTADVSDRLDADGVVRFRLNLVDESGGTPVADSHLSRQLASLALDFHLSPDTLLETNYSYNSYRSRGFPTNFSLAPSLGFPKNIDPTVNYSQPYAGNDTGTYTTSARLKHRFDGGWSLTAGILRQVADRENTGVTNTLINNRGDYTTTIQTATASRFSVLSNSLYLNGAIETGPIAHTLAIGTNGFAWDTFNPRGGRTFTLGTANLAVPRLFAEPAFSDFTDRFRSAAVSQQSLILSDTVKLTEQFSIMVTGSYSWLSARNTNVDGALTSSTRDQGWSPSISGIYKIFPNLTTYVTYASSLQQGDVAPVGTVNANTVLPSYRSEQWEVGSKWSLDGIDLNVAAFEITRPFAFIDPATRSFSVAGQQRNRGVEVLANGEILPGLVVFGGFTYLDARVLDTASSATSNKRIVGLPDFVTSLLFVWQVPGAPGLSFNAAARYASSSPTDNTNVFYAPDYATFDLGASYTALVGTQAFTFRVNAINLTDTRYFSTIYPGGLNGYTGAGNATAQLGAPRTIIASMQIDF